MDTANSFVMSSYQFVNSLASCYPQSQLNQQAATNNNNTNVSNANSGSNNDYNFPPSAYTPNLYPGASQNHYTNPQAAYGGALAGAGTGTGQPQGQNDMVDYAQLQPQKFLLNQQAAAAAAAAAVAQQQQNSQVNSQSCKYANENGPTGGAGGGGGGAGNTPGAPQDLSSGTRDISPKLSPSSVENVARGLNKPPQQGSGASGPMSTNSSNHNSSTGPLRSPEPDDSDASSESGGEESGSRSTNGKKGNPPHIYPWMKRVHIGQSE